MNLINLINNQEKLNGFNLSAIPHNTKLIIETNKSFYEVQVVEDNLVTIFGGTIENGTRFPKPIECRFIGSTWGGTAILPRWFGQNMCLEFCFPDRQILKTSMVKNIQIEDLDGKWHYSLDWK